MGYTHWRILEYSLLIFIFITFTKSHLDTNDIEEAGEIEKELKSFDLSRLKWHKFPVPDTINDEERKLEPEMSWLRSLAIYSREYNSTVRIPKCILLASRCLRWIHWNLLSCSNFYKQQDWYKTCVLPKVNTDKAKLLLDNWWTHSKEYHKYVFECIRTVEESYAFGIKMPIKQILEDAPAVALCLKFHEDEWAECVSSAITLDCSSASLCWKSEFIKSAKKDTESNLNAYYHYMISSCTNEMES